MEATLFYILAAVAVIATLFAITEKHAVHAIVYLVTSFFALAVVFYLLGAPLVAVFEVIIYAGAIMVLFLFVIMMLDLGHPEKAARPGMGDWWPALVLGAVIAGAVVVLAASRPAAMTAGVSVIGVREFGRALFQKYGIAVEIISMQLLFALVGAFYLGRRRPSPPAPLPEGEGGRRPGEGGAAREEETV
ncbi:NADH-quinone oxidoreductase subunit J [Geobacter luticola]|uniref:NADH-quinone oxidoreductase subunit J n=1 Tax=Geomobilimonas luticola TaxID=1114878 RepID=A0ABS5S8A8_9BACT|nr:NADH-quinone oxidoreductase subunit J [Geomobilimonas luticola]MBT0651611.1 NADH-quinone oxidoreductase subunit J [Geomobilimonas luticola]